MRRELLAWLVIGLVVLAACGGGQQVTAPGQQVPGDAERGRAAIADYGCIACHAVPGVPGNHNQVGPPLAGWAERRVIAGRLPNTPANVARWIRNPQAIDPDNVMPDVGVTREDAEHIAAYLYSLH